VSPPIAQRRSTCLYARLRKEHKELDGLGVGRCSFLHILFTPPWVRLNGIVEILCKTDRPKSTAQETEFFAVRLVDLGLNVKPRFLIREIHAAWSDSEQRIEWNVNCDCLRCSGHRGIEQPISDKTPTSVTCTDICTKSAPSKVHSLPSGRLPSSRCIRSAPIKSIPNALCCAAGRSRYSTKACRTRGMLTTAVKVSLQPAPESDATPEYRRSGMPAQAEGYGTRESRTHVHDELLKSGPSRDGNRSLPCSPSCRTTRQ
jgi:hypothetical protein